MSINNRNVFIKGLSVIKFDFSGIFELNHLWLEFVHRFTLEKERQAHCGRRHRYKPVSRLPLTDATIFIIVSYI